MKKKISPALMLVTCIALFFSSCRKNIEIQHQDEPTALNFEKNHANDESKKIYVSNLTELYDAINNPQNAGSTIVLAPGTYKLNPDYPNGGRLDFLHNMKLTGKQGHKEAVIIDVSNLPPSSLTLPPVPPATGSSRVGAIRMGNGSNTIEWVTVQNDPAHTIRSLIQTDIVTTPETQIRVAHCIIKGSSIGLSIINRDPEANGRILEADISDNEIMNNTIQQFGSGIQIQNTLVNNALIKVRLSRNYVHGNKAGMMIFNSSSQDCSLEVKSYNERIEDNGVGLVFVSGLILNAIKPAENNKLSYEAYATSLTKNNGLPAPPFSFPPGGIFAATGLAMTQFGPPGTTHYNQLDIRFYGSVIKNNIGSAQIKAYGAYSYYALPPFNNTTLAGTNNKTNVFLNGLGATATVNAVNSFPVESAGTNTVNLFN